MQEFLLERRLKEETPDLHRRVSDSILALQRLLETFLNWFPNFTDHSMLHCMDVLEFCNQLLGEQVQKLTVPECYVLMMGCYLHDVGMCINRREIKELFQKIDLKDYYREHPNASIAAFIRDFHNEYSGLFIRKHAALFDIPSETMLFAIIQIARGHRKTDLYDETEYPDLETPDGVIRTSYLSALLRLADEIDVSAERIPELLFDISNLKNQVDIDIFKMHQSILMVEVTQGEIILHAKPKSPRYVPMIETTAEKIQDTLDYCRDVAEKRSDLCISQKKVEIDYIDIDRS